MSFSYTYLLDWAQMLTESNPQTKVLDYGCGRGQVVKRGLDCGLDICGTDLFGEYSFSDARQILEENGLWNTSVRGLENDGEIPFADDSFDLVICNQVFEHILDLAKPLSEISRVLKPGGLFLCKFPTIAMMYEDHIGLPIVHWLPKDSALRSLYARSVRSLGFGHHRVPGEPITDWLTKSFKMLDESVFYHRTRDVLRQFGEHFRTVEMTDDFLLEALRAKRIPTPIVHSLTLPGLRSLTKSAAPWAVSHVFLATPKSAQAVGPWITEANRPDRFRRLQQVFGQLADQPATIDSRTTGEPQRRAA